MSVCFLEYGGLRVTAGRSQAVGMRELKCQMSGLMPGWYDGGGLCGGGGMYASLWPLRDSCFSEHIPVSWHLFPAVRISSLLISDLTQTDMLKSSRGFTLIR